MQLFSLVVFAKEKIDKVAKFDGQEMRGNVTEEVDEHIKLINKRECLTYPVTKSETNKIQYSRGEN